MGLKSTFGWARLEVVGFSGQPRDAGLLLLHHGQQMLPEPGPRESLGRHAPFFLGVYFGRRPLLHLARGLLGHRRLVVDWLVTTTCERLIT